MGFTHLNHFRSGFDGRSGNVRTRADQDWEVDFGRCRRQPGTFWEEAVEAARLCSIKAAWNDLSVNLLLSGGADSEFMVRAFHQTAMPFSVHIRRHVDGSNCIDFDHALEFCERFGIKPTIHEFDVRKFYQSEVYEYAAACFSVTPQGACNMALADKVGGFVVLGQGDQSVQKIDGEWYWVQWERSAGVSFRFFSSTGLAGAPAFFCYTPELMLAWLNDASIISMTSDAMPAVTDVDQIKCGIYRTYQPDMVLRPKLTGFEAYRDIERPIRRNLQGLYGIWDEVVSIPVNVVREQLCPR